MFVPAAMGEDDAFGLPGQHAFDRGLELRALAYEGAAHVARHRAVRVLHAAQAGEPAHPPAAELVAFEVLDEVGQHERSEEHTSELQSPMRISYAVFCLKKK